MVPTSFQEVIGSRGELMAELCLNEYLPFGKPFFRVAPLGKKWPVTDYYVELEGVRGQQPYFLIQVKSTSLPLQSRALKISTKRKDVQGLLHIPAPTYLFGVHEPTRRVFAKSVHLGVEAKAISRIELSNELTPANLKRLYDEVRVYWQSTGHKPHTSVFK